MTTLYTAVGRFERRSDRSGNRHPVVIVSGEEHIMGIHEMLLWTCLAWRVLELSQLTPLYEQKVREAGVGTDKPILCGRRCPFSGAGNFAHENKKTRKGLRHADFQRF
jgi:hypothetical protein